MLELANGTKIGQATTITRYIGATHGYYPEDPMLAAKCDFLIETYRDHLQDFFNPIAQGPDKAEENTKKCFEVSLPALMEKLAKFIPATGFLCGEKLTIADFWIAGLYTNFINYPSLAYGKDEWAAVKAKYPAFTAYGERYAEANKTWLSTRMDIMM